MCRLGHFHPPLGVPSLTARHGAGCRVARPVTDTAQNALRPGGELVFVSCSRWSSKRSCRRCDAARDRRCAGVDRSPPGRPLLRSGLETDRMRAARLGARGAARAARSTLLRTCAPARAAAVPQGRPRDVPVSALQRRARQRAAPAGEGDPRRARPAAHAVSAATTGASARSSSTTSTATRRSSGWRSAASAGRSTGPARRRASACCCARTATWRSRPGSRGTLGPPLYSDRGSRPG